MNLMKIEIDTNLDNEEEIMNAITLVQQTLARRKERVQNERMQTTQTAQAQQNINSTPKIITSTQTSVSEKKEMPKIILEEYSDMDTLRARQKEKTAARLNQEKTANDKIIDNKKNKKDDTDDIPKVEIVEY